MTSKKLIPFIFLTVLFSSVKAQIIFTQTNNGSKYKLVTPAIPQGLLNGYMPFTRVFLETGNGAFMQFSTPGNASYEYNRPWYFAGDTTVHPVVQLSRFYDTTRIPPLASSFAFHPPVDNSGTNFQNHLSGNQSIQITPSIAVTTPGPATVIPGDTMTLAITYKRIQLGEFDPTNDRTIVAFYYNGPGISNLFSPIDNTTQYNFSGIMTNAIRVHNSEIINPVDIPASIQYQLDQYKGSFTRVLYFRAPYNSSDAERNIFLSLAPNANPSDYTKLKSSVRAVILEYKSSNLNQFNAQANDQVFDINFLSRDPNYMTVFPYSFKNKTAAIDKKVDYHIHFENIGAGPANKIIIEVDLPGGFQLPVSGENIFRCTIGGSIVSMIDGLVKQVQKPLVPRTCSYLFDRIHNKITFTISNADLKGTIESNGINDRGDITFSLRTPKAVNQNHISTCMFSKVSIFFDGQNPEVSYFTTRVGPNFSIICNPNYSVVPPKPN